MRMALLAAVLALGACVEHRVTVEVPAPPADTSMSLLLITGHSASVPSTVVRRSALPIDLPVDEVIRDAHGQISRSSLRPQTATPWWQRFPADIATDLTPWPQVVASAATASASPVTPITTADLTTAARSAGYARP